MNDNILTLNFPNIVSIMLIVIVGTTLLGAGVMLYAKATGGSMPAAPVA